MCIPEQDAAHKPAVGDGNIIIDLSALDGAMSGMCMCELGQFITDVLSAARQSNPTTYDRWTLASVIYLGGDNER